MKLAHYYHNNINNETVTTLFNTARALSVSMPGGN